MVYPHGGYISSDDEMAIPMVPPPNDGHIRWFGPPWPRANYRAPVCEDDTYRVPTPVDTQCHLCTEAILEGENGTSMPYYDGKTVTWIYQHRECGLRTVLGCSAKLRGLPCDHENSYRTDALAVEAWVHQHGT